MKTPHIVRLVLLATQVFPGCQGAPPQSSGGDVIAAQCDDQYFRPGSLGKEAGSDDRLRKEFSRLLELIDAQPLWCGEQFSETYRLMALPSQSPALVITATRESDAWRVVTAVYRSPSPSFSTAQGGIRVSRQSNTHVDAQAAEELRTSAAVKMLWASRTLYEPAATDGVVWALEGRADGKYGIATRHQDRADPFADLARSLLRMSGSEQPPWLR